MIKQIGFILISGLFALAAANAHAAAIVVSDGPTNQPTARNGSPSAPKVVETDGPPEWVNASAGGQPLVGSWVVETDGPGKGRLVGPQAAAPPRDQVSVALPASTPPPAAERATKVAHVKKKVYVLPDPETATLAPLVPAKTPIVLPPAEKPIAISPIQAPGSPTRLWKWLVLVLASFVAVLSAALVWTVRKHPF